MIHRFLLAHKVVDDFRARGPDSRDPEFAFDFALTRFSES